MTEFLLILLGILTGVVINTLADDLPYRRKPGRPVYPDGTVRPISAWSGIVAFVLDERKPSEPEPNEARSRPDQKSQQLTWRYPLVEAGTAFLFVLTYLAGQYINGMNTLQLVFYLIFMAIFVLIIVIDVEYKLILFIVTLPSMALALLDAILVPVPGPNLQDALIGGLAGFVTFFILYQGGFLFTYIMGQIRGEEITTVAFGYGDVMMITLSGLLLGFGHTLLAMFLTVFLGAFGAISYLVIRTAMRNRYTLFTALPYGPYIVVATIIMLLFGSQVRMALLGY